MGYSPQGRKESDTTNRLNFTFIFRVCKHSLCIFTVTHLYKVCLPIGEGKGYPLQYSGLENSMDYVVSGVANSQTRQNNFNFT